HPRVRPPVLRDDRRRGPLSHRQRAARQLQRRGVERRDGNRAPAGDRPGRRRRRARLRRPMKILSSIRSRIFLASAVVAMLCMGIAIYLVSVRVTQEAETTLKREIFATGAEVDQLRAERTQTFTLMARLIADLPKLKAAVETDDPPTVEKIASGYQAH